MLDITLEYVYIPTKRYYLVLGYSTQIRVTDPRITCAKKFQKVLDKKWRESANYSR